MSRISTFPKYSKQHAFISLCVTEKYSRTLCGIEQHPKRGVPGMLEQNWHMELHSVRGDCF
jgi:hypothetical protein